jgi:hypothetical protein
MASSLRSCANPSRIAAGVIDCSQRRLIGLPDFANWTM